MSSKPSLHYEEHGAGPPLVLTHSFLCSGEMWAPLVEPLAETHRVVNIDLRGHGQSPPAREPFTIWDLAEDVVGVLDELEIESAVWCGLSIGGMLSMRAALRHPSRVRGLIVMDSSAQVDGLARRTELRILATIARWVGIRNLRQPVAKNMFGPTTRRERPDLVAEWQDRWSGVDVPSMLQALSALNRRDDILKELESLRVPTLVVVGSEDPSQPVARSESIHRAIEGSELAVISGAGHLSALERPEAVLAAVQAFLARLEAADHAARPDEEAPPPARSIEDALRPPSLDEDIPII